MKVVKAIWPYIVGLSMNLPAGSLWVACEVELDWSGGQRLWQGKQGTETTFAICSRQVNYVTEMV
jgi:hypothetical protein